MFIVAFNVAKVIEFRRLLSRRCCSYDAFKDVLCGFVGEEDKENFFLHLLQASEIETRHGWHEVLLMQHARFVITLYVYRSLAYAQWTRLNGAEEKRRRKFMIESKKNRIKVASP